jgi:hypothetical protein
VLTPSLILLLALSSLEEVRSGRREWARITFSVVLLLAGLGLLAGIEIGSGFWILMPWLVPAGAYLAFKVWQLRAKTGQLFRRWMEVGKRQPRHPMRLLQLSGILLTISGWTQLAFSIVFLSLMALMAEEDEGQVLLLTFGIPSWGKWVMYPLWLIAGSAILQAVCTAAILRDRGWSIWRKMLYVFASIVGLAVVGFLAFAGALSSIL